MRFWDTSALVPLIVREPTSSWAAENFAADGDRIVWGFTPVEISSALNRRRREQALTRAQFNAARQRAKSFIDSCDRVMAFELVAERALRVLDMHALRAADALQLAAALLASREQPNDVGFVTLDIRLAEAAEREGFPVLMHET